MCQEVSQKSSIARHVRLQTYNLRNQQLRGVELNSQTDYLFYGSCKQRGVRSAHFPVSSELHNVDLLVHSWMR